jgi:ribosome-binding protein aMBF1 (putative translation factor)
MANVTIKLSAACGTEIKNGIVVDANGATLTISRACAETLWLATGDVLKGPSGKKKKSAGGKKVIRKRKLGGGGGRNRAGG